MRVNFDTESAYINREVEVKIWDVPTKVHIYSYFPEYDEVHYEIKDSPLAVKLVEECQDLVDELETDLKKIAVHYVERRREEWLEEKARERADDIQYERTR